jgi:hypothetical protein
MKRGEGGERKREEGSEGGKRGMGWERMHLTRSTAADLRVERAL